MSKPLMLLPSHEPALSLPSTLRHLVEKAFFIRHFEERLLELFASGQLNGTVHTCSGQEWSAIALAEAVRPGDTVFSNHRGHGHFLAVTGNATGLLAEIMGRETGVCGGFGGSQHLYAGNFLSSGIQGGMTPIATGMALAYKIQEQERLAFLCIGDGTLGEGVLYESLNLASLWQVPLVIVLENNGYAQSTATSTTIAGSAEDRARAFDVSYRHGSTRRPGDLLTTMNEAANYARSGRRPILVEVQTSRLNAHSKGDDNRDTETTSSLARLDPLNVWAVENPAEYRELAGRHRATLDAAIAEALAALPCRYQTPRSRPNRIVWGPAQAPSATRYGELINIALDRALATFPRVILLGEDIESPYGGAFKVTKGLSAQYPGRVRNMPISEAAIVGAATGLALAGFLPITEIMFGDFLTLTLDQLLQHAAKFHAMYNGHVRVPIVLRTPMGGRRGYGPTHSQSIEKHFLGIPGLNVAALNHRIDPIAFYGEILAQSQHPTLIIENKVLYTRTGPYPLPPGYIVEISDEQWPTLRLRPQNGKADVTIACYGDMLYEVEAALPRLFYEYEILCEVLCPSQLSPVDAIAIVDGCETETLLVVEEGSNEVAWGSEIIAQFVDHRPIKTARMGHQGIIPACHLTEQQLLPNSDSIIERVRNLHDG